MTSRTRRSWRICGWRWRHAGDVGPGKLPAGGLAMTPLPVIGITCNRERARWRMWNEIADLLDASYARAIELVGGVPVLLPPQRERAAGSVIARLDGLVISGGRDVDPNLYGAEPHPATGSARPDRDSWELALLASSRDAGLPVLGVCR